MDRGEDWLRVMARITGAGALLLDESARPVTADASGLRLLGCRTEPELTEAWSSLAPRAAEWCAAAARGQDAGGVVNIAIDGEPATVVARVVALDAADCPGAPYVVLLTAASASAAGESLAVFARRLGHDLRGPLNAMVLNLDLIRLSVEESDDGEEALAKRRRFLANLQREIDRLSEMLRSAVDEAKRGGT